MPVLHLPVTSSLLGPQVPPVPVGRGRRFPGQAVGGLIHSVRTSGRRVMHLLGGIQVAGGSHGNERASFGEKRITGGLTF